MPIKDGETVITEMPIKDGETAITVITLEQLARRICNHYEDCREGDCPGFDFCNSKQNGVLVWLREVLKDE